MKLLGNERQSDEDYETYRARRTLENAYIQMHLKKGVVFWPSWINGQYRKDGRTHAEVIKEKQGARKRLAM